MKGAVTFVAGAVLGYLVLLTQGRQTLVLDLGEIPRSWEICAAAAVCTVLAMIPIALPIQFYRKHGQAKRVDQIVGFYPPDVIADYLTRFWSAKDAFSDSIRGWQKEPNSQAAQTVLKTKFRDLLQQEVFGQDRVTNASYVLLTVCVIELFFAFEGGLMLAAGSTGHYLLNIQPNITSLAAIFGAYTWVTSDIISRYRLNNLGSSNLYWYSLRFIIAVPLGEAIAAFAGGAGASAGAPATLVAGPVLAFVLSMFSLPRIQSMLSALAVKTYNLPVTTDATKDDVVIQLPGIDQDIADVLAAESVNTIAAIAAADPVMLSGRTAIPFNLVLEYIDCALLWKFVGSKLLIMREFGWAGASHVLNTADRWAEQQAQFQRAVAVAAASCEARKTALEDAQRQVDDAAAKVTEALAADDPLRAALLDAKAAVVRCQSACDSADQAQKAAAASLLDAQNVIATFYNDLADQAKTKVSGLECVEASITTNDYARFIRRLMLVGATSSARADATADGTAIPLHPGPR